MARRHGDFGLAGVVAIVGLAPDGPHRVGLVSCSSASARRLIRAAAAEQMLMDQAGEPALFAAVGARAAADLDEPLTDVHATADYRRDLARVLTARALAEATTRARAA